MLASFDELLAGGGAGALVGFSCYNLETAEGVLSAAESADVPVLLLVSDAAFRGAGGRRLFRALVSACAISSVPAGVQLDHCSGRGILRQAAELGACAVMADFSALPFAENVKATGAAVRDAAIAGVAVEAELGRVGGNEDVAGVAYRGTLTDPAEASDFCEMTGVQALAVSIGNVHGVATTRPELDLDRLARISDVVDVPLTLHGASGLARADIERAVVLGVQKLNVNTELRQAYLDGSERDDGYDLLNLHRAQASRVAAVADKWLHLSGVNGPTL